jgi:hypothetical protein
VLGVSDCVADRIWPGIPQASEWQRIGNQIKAAFVSARADFVNVSRHFFRFRIPLVGSVAFAFLAESLYVHLTMIESNNGESLLGTCPVAPKRHNAKNCPFAIRERIVNALANGDSKRSIARALRVSNNTVTAIAEQEWQRVAARKAKLAARSEKLADLYTERQIDELESGAKIPLNLCQSGGGIATDKAMALRGDSSLTIQHDVVLSQQSRQVETALGLFDLIESIAVDMKPLLDQVPAPEMMGDYTSPIMDASVCGLNFITWLASAKARALAKAKVVAALSPGDASVGGENAAQKADRQSE